MAAAPLELIEQGLVEGSFAKIAKGFEKLTGKRLAPPKESKSKGKTKTVTKEVEVLSTAAKSALTFYANPDNWKAAGDAFDPKPARVAGDRGELARGALGTVDIEVTTPEPSATPKPSNPRDIPDFTVQHGTARVRGNSSGNPGRVEAFRPTPNSFVDDGVTAANEIASDKLLNSKVRPSERRSPAKTVQVECSKCHGKEHVSEAFAPGKIGDEQSIYVCQSCIRERATR